MFTGIVQTTGTVAAIEPLTGGNGVRFVIDHGGWTPEGGYVPELGHSICVSGACLTLVSILGNAFGFDVIQQTLAVTTLGQWEVGTKVNLEPAVLPTQPMGGHFMQGHVDGIGEVVTVKSTPEEWRTVVRPPAGLMPYMTPRGSVTIDGVSLTIAELGEDTIEVALIPTTLELTTLGRTREGSTVNLEADVLTKTVVQTLKRMQGEGGGEEAVTMDLLKQAGFVNA